MSISFPSADFAPTLSGYTGQGAFRFWCQKVLPIVYDDSLSYYELLNKVVNYLNNVIADVASVEDNIGRLNNSYGALQSYVNEHLQEIVDIVNKYTEFTDNYFNNLDVQEEINTKLDEMAGDGSLSAVIAPLVALTAPDIITQWLNNNITPTTPVVDNSLTISAAAADAKVTGDFTRHSLAAMPECTEVFYNSGGLSTDGDTNTNVSRIRSKAVNIPQIDKGDTYFCDDRYLIRIGIYNAPFITPDNFYQWANEQYENGLIPIPQKYAGKYCGISIMKIGLESADISGDVPTIMEHVKYLSHAKKYEEINGVFNDAFNDGNNILPIEGQNIFNFDNRLVVKVYNGIISIKGNYYTSQTHGSLRIKLTNGFAYLYTTQDPEEWREDTITAFTHNEKYALTNIVLDGTLPTTVGAVLVDNTGTNILSRSIPETTITSQPSYVKLVIQPNTDIDVTFIPMFIKGGVGNPAYLKKLNQYIKVEGVKYYDTPNLTRAYIYNSELEYAIKFPSSYKATGNATPLIINCHGLTSTLDESSWGAMTVVNKFVNAGYAVMDVNGITTQDWCNPALIAKYVKAISDIKDKYNVAPLFVYGYSMGSLIGLTMSKVIPGIKAAVISGIRLDLQARYNTATPEEKAIIDANLGFTDGFDYFKIAGWCMTAYYTVNDNNEKINPAQFPPTAFMYGTSDPLTKEESLEKIYEIRRGETICSIKEYNATHGEICTLSAGTSFDDAVAWFNLWNS